MPAKFFDVHTHTQFAAFGEDAEAVRERALEAGVWMLNVGTQRDTSEAAIAVARQYAEGVYASVGLHPVHTAKSYHDAQELGVPAEASAKAGEVGFISRGEVFNHDAYKTLAQNEKVLAIGECGLDYYRVSEDTAEKQRAAFIAQIALANEVGKPLMLHIRSGEGRNAYRDGHEILASYAKVRGNVHFFAGSVEDSKLFLAMGYTLSFTGVITFTHDYDEVVSYAPLDMLHAETDAPYVAPVPYRGKRNEPLYVQEVVKRIAEIKGMDFEKVRAHLCDNARRLFGV